MKKTVALIICAALALSFVGCGAKASEKAGDTMAVSDIMTKILEGVDAPATQNIELSEQNFKAFAFIDYIEGAQAMASEAVINTVPHSVVVLRLPEGAKTADVAAAIEHDANANKWICVFAEKTVVNYHGRTVLLVMSKAETADAIASNFDALWK